MKAWHFVGETLLDGRAIPEDGEWLEHQGRLIMCESGLHASRKITDALKYAPGSTVCRVKIGENDYIEEGDKLVARRRKILWRVDGEAALRAFARWCALQVVHLWNAPEIVIKYLRSGDDSLKDASWHPAWDAAWHVSVETDRDITRDAAMQPGMKVGLQPGLWLGMHLRLRLRLRLGMWLGMHKRQSCLK